VRHLLKGVKQKPEVALAVAADLHGRQLTTSFSLIHTLNALRRCVVDPEVNVYFVTDQEFKEGYLSVHGCANRSV
jgi:hypothetical protein